jgi:hypothetical protein
VPLFGLTHTNTYLRMTRIDNQTQTDNQTDNRSPNQTDKRRLVVCIDGTSNQFGPKVWILHIRLRTHIDANWRIRTPMSSNSTAMSKNPRTNSHITIAASVPMPNRWKSMSISSTTASSLLLLRTFVIELCGIIWYFRSNVHKGVLKAYRWLSDNYIKNDDIFLFGM